MNLSIQVWPDFWYWHSQLDLFIDKVYFKVKTWPIFDGSQSNSLTWCPKVLLGLLENILKSICLIMKFYDCHHATVPYSHYSIQCTYTWLKAFIKTNEFYLFFPALWMYFFMYLLTWNTLLWSSRMHWRCNGKCMWVQSWDITLWLVDLLLCRPKPMHSKSPDKGLFMGILIRNVCNRIYGKIILHHRI